MQLDDFDYELPAELIAQQPLAERSQSRLLHIDRADEQLADYQFPQLLDLLRPGDLLVMNNTKVLPARLLGEKPSGGRVEILLERVLSAHEMLAQVRSNRSLKSAAEIVLAADVALTVVGREQNFYRLRSHRRSIADILQKHGEIPLPPYISRAPDDNDMQRYQTVYAAVPGAVAAPTAGLHFDWPLLQALRKNGIETAAVTLHVGAGTFQPVRVDNILQHTIHAEYLEVDADTCHQINMTKSNGGRIIAIGTTTLRALETAAAEGELRPFSGDSQLFVYPGYEFKVIDGLLTNFHLPKSTLLMLVSALAGVDLIRAAYAHAVVQKYRFFSYGDAMLIT